MRRSPIERTAHFFMKELGERLNLVGPSMGIEFNCLRNQYLLAAALNLSAVHVNCVLHQLTRAGLAQRAAEHGQILSDPGSFRDFEIVTSTREIDSS